MQVKENGVVTAEYEYDQNGNRTAYITPSDTVTATYDDQDRMLSYSDASYSYGKRGDLQRKIVGTDTISYNYDNLGNLRSVVLPDGTVIEYIIDGQNRRIGKKVNGIVIKRWLYQDQFNPVAELDSAGNIATRFVYGTRAHVPDYIVKNDTTYRVISSHLGSVKLVVNIQTGEIAQFTAVETGVIAAGTSLANFAIVGASYEVGLGLGSLLSAAIWPDWPPCDDNGDIEVNQCK